MDAAARALAEPRRREILALVAQRELAAGAIAAHFEVTRPAISQHLAVLKEAGLLHERKQGTHRFYRARPEGLADLRSFLEGFWDERLYRLKQATEAHERSIRRHAVSRNKRRARGQDQRKA
jgi:DNA-binding transcriptional ArsR family regulator